MDNQQESKVVIISGGSRGLGQAMVADLLGAGYRVGTFSRSKTPFIEQCLAQDPDHQSFYWESVDGTNFPLVRKFVQRVEERFGQIDTVINNAGVGVDGILATMTDDDIHRGITLNLEAAIQLTRACLKSMLRTRSGCVINVSSVNAIRGFSGVSVYSATKAALGGLTRSLAREYGPEGIRVNTVAPGYFESDMTSDLTDRQKAWIIRQTPLKKLGSVKDLVGVVRFLISPEASFITGQTFIVDGGLTC